MEQIFTAGDLLKSIGENHVNPTALNTYVDDKWVNLSTEDLLREIQLLALGLIKLGLVKGDFVGIIAPGSSRWMLIDLAIMSIGMVTVPLFPNTSDEHFHHEMTEIQPKLTFIDGKDGWECYQKNSTLFNQIVLVNSNSDSDTKNDTKEDHVISYAELLEIGAQLYKDQPLLYEQFVGRVKPADIATILYTSGSTGLPKAVVHTHSSLLSLIHVDLFQLNVTKDRYLSVLPLTHIYTRTINLIIMGWGISIYFYDDLKNLSKACREVHPTILSVVPRLLEKVYVKMVLNVHKASFLKRSIAQFAFDIANQEEDTLWKSFFHPLAEHLVYSHLREALGDQLRVVISGGATLDMHLQHFFHDIGIAIYEGWGLTEACPISVNRPGHNKIGSVGFPIGSMEVTTNSNGELLARGPRVMLKYYNNPEATAATIDSDGWLHTGDKGSIDEEGYITITGRLKEIFKTSTGKLVTPIPIENALTKVSFIEMAVVIAERRRFVACLLVPNFEVLRSLKVSHHLSDQTDEDFLKSDSIQLEIKKLISSINEHLDQWEQIRDYRFIPEELSVERGEMTPTMKIVRKVIEKKYKTLIDSMYNEDKS